MKAMILFILAFSMNAQMIDFYTGFDKDITSNDGWLITSLVQYPLPAGQQWQPAGGQYFKCGDKPVFGGPKWVGKTAIISRTFNLPNHYEVRIQTELFQFGQWDNLRMQMIADGYPWETLWKTDASTGLQPCGSTPAQSGKSYTIDIKFSHNQNTLNVYFTSALDKEPNYASFGIRNFRISYSPCPAACSTCLGDDVALCQQWKPFAASWQNMETDIEGWTLDKKVTVALTTSCVGVKMFGGVNVFGKDQGISRIYQGLIPHYRLKVVFQFWKIDNWNAEQGKLQIDGRTQWSQIFGDMDGFTLCPKAAVGGVDKPERIFNVNAEIPHNFDAAQIKISASLKAAANQASWGVRQFAAYVAKCADNCSACTGPLMEDCTACVSPYVMSDEEGVGCILDGDWVQSQQDLNGQWAAASPDWQVTKANGAIANSCGAIKMLGGVGVFGVGTTLTRKFTLPPHKRVRLVFEAWKLGKWFGESFNLSADQIPVWSQKFGFGDQGNLQVCSTAEDTYDNFIKGDVIFGHQANSLVISLTTDLDAKNTAASWGFREFTLYIEKPDFCATLFTQCNYRGKSFKLCDQQPNFSLAKFPSKVRSIQVPAGGNVVLFDEQEYKGFIQPQLGLKIEYSANVDCIQDYNFQYLEEPRVVLTSN